jgi:hypothetical protein
LDTTFIQSYFFLKLNPQVRIFFKSSGVRGNALHMSGRILYILQRLFLASWAGHCPQHLPQRTHSPLLLACHDNACFFFKYQTILRLSHPSIMENLGLGFQAAAGKLSRLASHIEPRKRLKRLRPNSKSFQVMKE